jgi:hypothetical protein
MSTPAKTLPSDLDSVSGKEEVEVEGFEEEEGKREEAAAKPAEESRAVKEPALAAAAKEAVVKEAAKVAHKAYLQKQAVSSGKKRVRLDTTKVGEETSATSSKGRNNKSNKST